MSDDFSAFAAFLFLAVLAFCGYLFLSSSAILVWSEHREAGGGFYAGRYCTYFTGTGTATLNFGGAQFCPRWRKVTDSGLQ